MHSETSSLSYRWSFAGSVISFVALLFISGDVSAGPYAWPGDKSESNRLQKRIPAPAGYRRVETNSGFARWLRDLPLKTGRPAVRLYDGRRKPNQAAHHLVIDMDVGQKDLQQCADAVMRLRAEYLYSQKAWKKIRFNFTDGVPARYHLWRQGYRPRLRKGRKTAWTKRARADGSYASFRRYMDSVFMYAGTYSLSREMKSVKVKDMRIGDVFIQGGFPGHAVLVIDLAQNKQTGAKKFLLAQSFMPAQEMHVLVGPGGGRDPWYPLGFGESLRTPEWDFSKNDLKRFRD